MKFGFIGCGNMASAIINGGLKKGIFTKEELLASVKTEASAGRFRIPWAFPVLQTIWQ